MRGGNVARPPLTRRPGAQVVAREAPRGHRMSASGAACSALRPAPGTAGVPAPAEGGARRGSRRDASARAAGAEPGVLDVLAAAAATRRGGRPAAPAAPPSPGPRVVVMRGEGCSLGLASRWSLAFDASDDGMGFADEVVLDSGERGAAPPLSARSGYDPGADVAWDTELGSGVCRETALDGAHRSLLVTWVRTGQWLNGPAARRRLHVRLLGAGASLQALLAEFSLAPRGDARALAAAGRSRGKGGKGPGGRKGGKGGGRRRGRAPGPPPPVPSGEGLVLAVAARGGRTGGRLWLGRFGDGWVPHRLELATPEGVEAWVFGGWAATECGLVLPGVSHQTLPAGGAGSFTLASAVDEGGGGDFSQPYAGYPAGDPRWPSPTYAAGAAPAAGAAVACARGEGGHVLVAPRLGGEAAPGWFVLDTSSAGFAIDPSAADALSMPAFGELSVVGVAAATLRGAMRRGSSLGLGQCTLPSPLFMEQSLGAALRTPPGPGGAGLVGVLGADFLAHCVLEIRAPRRPPGELVVPKMEVAAFAPGAYAPTERCEASWQRVYWVGGVPHVRVRVTVAEDRVNPLEGSPEEGSGGRGPEPGTGAGAACGVEGAGAWEGRLFRLSLGTGGTGLIVSARAAAEWALVGRTAGLQPGGVLSGPGEERSRLARVEPEVVTGRVSALEFRGARFETVRALTHTGGDPPDLALSPHADGALCADLFRGCTLVLDLGRDRVAVMTHGEGGG